jgi:hypothetical protein
MSNVYALTTWSPEDIKSLRPEWSLEQAEEWLESNERHIQTRLVELGWDVIESLLPPKGEEDEE